MINETLRLFPPVPLNVRETRGSACALPPPDATYANDGSPLYMPSRTLIMYFPILTQRSKALWGADADEFDPERWVDGERLERFLANPSIWAPFSAGPRIVRLLHPLLFGVGLTVGSASDRSTRTTRRRISLCGCCSSLTGSRWPWMLSLRGRCRRGNGKAGRAGRRSSRCGLGLL